MLTRPVTPHPWHIVLLTCRAPSTDFRLPLAQALQELGNRVHYIHLKRRPVVTDMGEPSRGKEFSPIGLLNHVRAILHSSAPLAFFNSTNLRFPLFSHVLRLACGGLWCFDMHDELLYATTGIARAKARLAQKLLLSGSDLTVHAAPALQRLFTASHHLGNASSMPRLQRHREDFTRALILASIDRRLDFDFLAATARAAPATSFHIHGDIAADDARIAARLKSVIGASTSIHYHGPYNSTDLPGILASYSVMFAPYALSPLTDFIDPLRFYHGINSGMEVISTPIPRARDLSHLIHIAGDPAAAAEHMTRLADSTVPRLNADPGIRLADWRDKAKALIDILAVHHRKAAHDQR